jgi:hypothetical protein
LRVDARKQLGDLFNELEYPSTLQLSGSFQCEVRIYPMPDVKDFRTEVLQSEKDAFISDMRSVEETAMRECWTRLHDVVAKAVQKLSQPDAIFRDSLIQNITDMCALLPKLNITDDPTLEKARREVEALAATISPDVCRDNPTQRQATAKRLSDLTSLMGSFMGEGA